MLLSNDCSLTYLNYLYYCLQTESLHCTSELIEQPRKGRSPYKWSAEMCRDPPPGSEILRGAVLNYWLRYAVISYLNRVLWCRSTTRSSQWLRSYLPNYHAYFINVTQYIQRCLPYVYASVPRSRSCMQWSRDYKSRMCRKATTCQVKLDE